MSGIAASLKVFLSHFYFRVFLSWFWVCINKNLKIKDCENKIKYYYEKKKLRLIKIHGLKGALKNKLILIKYACKT